MSCPFGLAAELLARLDELQESRKRLVDAQDQERRRIERDLHDGAQQYLVALKTRLGLAKKLGERDPKQALGLMTGLEDLAGETLDTLGDLARDIYPPLLADQGLKAALEALQNAAKYAQASQAIVRLTEDDGTLVFSVSDDGRGFEPATTPKGSGMQNMTDRLEALGGTLHISSPPAREQPSRAESPPVPPGKTDEGSSCLRSRSSRTRLGLRPATSGGRPIARAREGGGVLDRR